MDPKTFDTSYLSQDLRSESTLPLLNFCLQLNPHSTADQIKDKLHELTASIGIEKRPLPDESEQLQTELLKLISTGVPKVTGDPSVRSHAST